MKGDDRVMARLAGLIADTDWGRALLPFQARLDKGASLPAIQAPRLVLEALGHDSPWIDDLCTALGLFYAFLDLADDVEDGELPKGWPQAAVAQNAADGLLFRALRLAHDLDGQAHLGGRLTQAFVEAGCHLTWGQDRDLRNQDLTPEAVLATVEAKTGRSLQLYVVASALLAGVSGSRLEQLAAFGLHWGMVQQLVGDWWDIWKKPHSPDLANRRITYPIAWALASPKGEQVRRQLDTPLDDPLAQLALRCLLESVGAEAALWQQIGKSRTRALQSLEAADVVSPHLVSLVDWHPPG